MSLDRWSIAFITVDRWSISCQTALMADPIIRSPRRSDALSRERIVAAAVEILDQGGEGELTVRRLTAQLSTGRGALYHHMDGKDDLLAAATDQIIARVTAGVVPEDEAGAAIRALALGIFAAIDTHPWVGPQLVRDPRQAAVLKIWTSVGTQLQRLGVDPATLPDAGSALVSYVLGSAAQYVAGPRTLTDEADRKAYLDQLAALWVEHDPDPLVAGAAANLREHDDRAQFLAGVDIFLAGATR